jgi:hypothetical protein
MTYKSSTVETALLLLRELLTHPVVDKENNSGLLMRIQQDGDDQQDSCRYSQEGDQYSP